MPFQIAWLPLFNGAHAQNKTVTAGAFLDNDKAVLTCFCEQHWDSEVPQCGKVRQENLDFAFMLWHACC